MLIENKNFYLDKKTNDFTITDVQKKSRGGHCREFCLIYDIGGTFIVYDTRLSSDSIDRRRCIVCESNFVKGGIKLYTYFDTFERNGIEIKHIFVKR